jgi:hypothetical protein
MNYTNKLEQLEWYAECIVNNYVFNEETALKLGCMITGTGIGCPPEASLMVATDEVEKVLDNTDTLRLMKENSQLYLSTTPITNDADVVIVAGFVIVNVLTTAALKDDLYRLATLVGIDFMMGNME